MTKLSFSWVTQQRRAICRILLLIVLLEITSISKCRSNQKFCTARFRRNLSYFKVDNMETDWNTASQECNDRNSTLPVICNQDEQDALTNFLMKTMGSTEVWASGKKINFTGWTWINGNTFIGRVITSSGYETETHVALGPNGNYWAVSPQRTDFYLCQYSGSCTLENLSRVTNGCVRSSHGHRSWYDARNQCLLYGGDLAVLNDADLVTLRQNNQLHTNRIYWIGLRLITWQWKFHGTDNSNKEVTYTNWSDELHSPTDDCISINAINGHWKAVACTAKKRVLCQRISDGDTSSRPSSFKIASPSTKMRSSRPTTRANATSVGPTTNSPTTWKSQSNTVPQSSRPSSNLSEFIAVLILAVCTIVISNIIATCFVRKCVCWRLSDVTSREEPTKRETYEDLETVIGQQNPTDAIYTDLEIQQTEYEDLVATDNQTNTDGTNAYVQLQIVYEDVGQLGK